jgi:hypothetical protein
VCVFGLFFTQFFFLKILISFCSLHILQKSCFFPHKCIGSCLTFKCTYTCAYK